MALDFAPSGATAHDGSNAGNTTPRVGAKREAPGQAHERDTTIDAVRTVCLLGVVVLHALMVGVTIDSGGALMTSVAMHGHAWFAPITWVLQVMPMFFIAGGFASISQWRRMRARGTHWTQYVASRVSRLLVPGAIMIVVVGVSLGITTLVGLPNELAAEAGYRIGQPLWFLAVYLGTSALVPFMVQLHERAPARTLFALAAGIVAVDVIRIVSGIEGIGFVNLAFAWLFAQQLGFGFHDGWAATWSRGKLFAGLGIAIASIAALVLTGLWSADLITNLNPPTIVLSLLAVAHWFGLRLLKPVIDRRMQHRRAIRALAFANPIAMTVYLWHMPIIMLLVGGMWTVGMPLPEPHSIAWWATRLPWLLIIVVIVVAAAPLLSKIERIKAPAPEHLPVWRAVLMILLAIASVATVLLSGLGNFPAVMIGAGFAVLAIASTIRLSATTRSSTRVSPSRPLGRPEA